MNEKFYVIPGSDFITDFSLTIQIRGPFTNMD